MSDRKPDIIAPTAPRTVCRHCGSPIALTTEGRWVHLIAPFYKGHDGRMLQAVVDLDDGTLIQPAYATRGCRSAGYSARGRWDDTIPRSRVARPTPEFEEAMR